MTGGAGDDVAWGEGAPLGLRRLPPHTPNLRHVVQKYRIL